jgi:hypothetical protein
MKNSGLSHWPAYLKPKNFLHHAQTISINMYLISLFYMKNPWQCLIRITIVLMKTTSEATTRQPRAETIWWSYSDKSVHYVVACYVVPLQKMCHTRNYFNIIYIVSYLWLK